jgi:hypothetical protein
MKEKVSRMIEAHLREIEESMGDQTALEYNIHAIREILNVKTDLDQLSPSEDQRIYKGVVSVLIKKWRESDHLPEKEYEAMEWLRDEIFKIYELRKRQSAITPQP